MLARSFIRSFVVSEFSILPTGSTRCKTSEKSTATTKIDCACSCEHKGFTAMFWRAGNKKCHCPTVDACVDYGTDQSWEEFSFGNSTYFLFFYLFYIHKQYACLTKHVCSFFFSIAPTSSPTVSPNQCDGMFLQHSFPYALTCSV